MCPLLFYCTSKIVHVRTVWKFSNTWKQYSFFIFPDITAPQYFLLPSSDISKSQMREHYNGSHYNSYNVKAWYGIYNRKGSFFPRNNVAICTNVSMSSYDCCRISTIAISTLR